MMTRAQDISQVYSVMRQEPLAIEDLDLFYVDTNEVRGGVKFRSRLARILDQTIHAREHILFVGYKGCGKSTELNHLQKDIKDNFFVLNFSVQDELDPINLSYIEIFIVTMQKLFKLAEEEELKISQVYIDSLSHWLYSEEIREVSKVHNLGLQTEAGVEAKLDIPFLSKFFAKFKLTAQTNRMFKETLKQKIEPKLSDLIEACNDLIGEVLRNLDRINKKDLLVIIEDLDKLPYDKAKELFFDHAQVLTQLKTNIIFTFPIALFHHTQFNVVKPYFTTTMELPMIKTKNKNDEPFTQGKDALKRMLSQRMALEVFEEAGLIDKFIDLSGGVIRDLFMMVNEAAGYAMDYERTQITEIDYQHARNKLKREYESNVGDYRIDQNFYSADDYYKALIALHKSKTKKLSNTEVELHLRQNLSILGYNGEYWYDLHPIMREILREQEKI